MNARERKQISNKIAGLKVTGVAWKQVPHSDDKEIVIMLQPTHNESRKSLQHKINGALFKLY